MTEAALLTEEDYNNPSDALKNEAEAIFKMAFGEGSKSGDPPTDTDPAEDDRPADHGTRETDDGEKTSVGRDDLLRYLENDPNAPPGSAELLRGMQKTISSQGSTVKELGDRLAALEENMAEKITATPPEPTPEEMARQKLLSNVSDRQRETLQALIEEMGYVRKEELETKDAEVQLDQLFTKDVKSALDEFGEDFGVAPEDMSSIKDFEWNPEIKEGVSELFEQMTSESQGILPRQLYILYRFPELIAKAEERGRASVLGDKAAGASRFPVSSGSVPQSGNNNIEIYKKGDSLDDVVKRATLAASRQIQRMGLG